MPPKKVSALGAAAGPEPRDPFSSRGSEPEEEGHQSNTPGGRVGPRNQKYGDASSASARQSDPEAEYPFSRFRYFAVSARLGQCVKTLAFFGFGVLAIAEVADFLFFHAFAKDSNCWGLVLKCYELRTRQHRKC